MSAKSLVYKVCGCCKQSLPLASFYPNKSGKYKVAWACVICSRARRKVYREQCADKVKQQKILYYQQNKELVQQKVKKYQELNKVAIRQRKRTYSNKQRAVNLQFRIKEVLRSRLVKLLKNKPKVGSAVQDLGCSIDQLKAHLESQFQPGMSWESYGKCGWHIDHIKPLASFDLTDENQLKQACHYTNLQPLWARDNLSKGAKVQST
jgi:hypothetical protein